MKNKLFIFFLLFYVTISSVSALSITGREIGNDVVFTYQGSIKIGGLTFSGTGTLDTEFEPIDNEFAAGGSADFYTIPDLEITGSMGTGSDVSGIATGDVLGIFTGGLSPSIWLPTGYTSGNSITGTITFSNDTFIGMGITENNTVTYSWGSAPNSDSITFSTVPEPLTSTLWVGLLSLVIIMIRRSKC